MYLCSFTSNVTLYVLTDIQLATVNSFCESKNASRAFGGYNFPLANKTMKVHVHYMIVYSTLGFSGTATCTGIILCMWLLHAEFQ